MDLWSVVARTSPSLTALVFPFNPFCPIIQPKASVPNPDYHVYQQSVNSAEGEYREVRWRGSVGGDVGPSFLGISIVIIRR
jgi:hypothetical protein